MELRQLAYFLAAAQTQNFSKAAILCLVAQPALSRQIAALETELGVALFRREKQRVKLTPAGREFMTYAKCALDAAQQGQQMMVKLQKGLQGIIHVGSIRSLASVLLPRVFASFHKRYPAVHLQVKVSPAQQLVSLVEQEKIDLGLTFDPIIQSDIVVARELFRQSLQALVAFDHPLTHEDPASLTLERIIAEPLIAFDESSRVRRITERLLYLRGLSAQPVAEIDSIDGVKELVRLGCGVALILPAFLQSTPGLKLLPISDLSEEFPFTLIYCRFGTLPAASLQFINTMIEGVPATPGTPSSASS
ncbi:LysR family transcriptional regulator [Ktedonosporobacter rubrisoli]|uniref:LysR family transcriptional regulator n=1 Tax=Ktedonosporobacter rubrisoli TaxID=2509675 RepID=A0A4P6JL57_KTERU|nr:LysR family transcriptional regulator [Ktedonosporobacter rubrisoli]QBD75722.1 LysR family transcriptional regulator [Ktedonosporobacter rubrisoli]